ncbi:MAG: hypothetical protein NWR87_04255 [Rhodospirillales bacterium]|nr:hypothetical protein [Rhodospirillales bacterium]
MQSRLTTAVLASAFSVGVAFAMPISVKADGDTIVLGSANSLTGKYSSNGIDTQNG